MATISTGGAQLEVKNLNISTALSAVSFDHAVNSFILKTRSAGEFRVYTIHDDGDNVEYWTVRSGGSISIDCTGQEKQTTVCWVRTTSGTDILEALGVF